MSLVEEIKQQYIIENEDKIILIGPEEPFYDPKEIKEFTYERVNGRIPDEAYFKALRLSGGNITKAAKLLGISRIAYYEKQKNSLDFKKTVEDIRNRKIDYVEDKLHELIEIGHPQSIQFYLSTIGKDRGYNKTTEIVGDRNNPVQININMGDIDNDEEYG